jgi:hypothetical protein
MMIEKLIQVSKNKFRNYIVANIFREIVLIELWRYYNSDPPDLN